MESICAHLVRVNGCKRMTENHFCAVLTAAERTVSAGPVSQMKTYRDLGLGVWTMKPNRRQSLSPRARERLPALAFRVTVLSIFCGCGLYLQPALIRVRAVLAARSNTGAGCTYSPP